MTEDKMNYLKDVVNTDYSNRHDIPQMHFMLSDLKYLIEQAEKVKQYEKNFSVYTDTLNQTRRKRDEVKDKLAIALKEIKLRKQYEGFLKSCIRSGESLSDEHTFEWFCERKK